MVDFQKEPFFKHFQSSFKEFLKELFTDSFSFERIKLAYKNFGGDPLQLRILTTLLIKSHSEENTNPLFFCLQRRIQHHLIMFYSLVHTIYTEKMIYFLQNNQRKLDQWGMFLLNNNSDMNRAIVSIKRNSFSFDNMIHSKKIRLENKNKLFKIIEIDSDNESDFDIMHDNSLSKKLESTERRKCGKNDIKQEGIDTMRKLFLTNGGKLSDDSLTLITTCIHKESQQKQLEHIYKQLENINEDHIAEFTRNIYELQLPNENKILHYLITVRVINSNQFISRTMYNIVLDLFNNNLEFLLGEFFCTLILNQGFSNCHEDIIRRLIVDQYLDAAKIEIVLKNVMASVNLNWNSAHVSLLDCLLQEKPKISHNDFNIMLMHFDPTLLSHCIKLMRLTIFLMESYPCQVVQSYDVLKHIISLNNTFLRKNAKVMLDQLKSKRLVI